MDYTIETMARDVTKIGGHFYYSGGCVRDRILGLSPRDIDVESYGLSQDQLSEFLSKYGKLDNVGKSFGVLKFKGDGFDADFTLPRKDSKVGSKHTDFEVEYDPFMSMQEACSRRDYTINSMLEDVLTGEIFDFFGGHDDLFNRILRATSNAFSDDVLRVIRGMQLAARFDLKVETKTAEMCKNLAKEYDSLSPDRVWMEWLKWATLSSKPSAGLQFLMDVGWSKFYPEFHLNIGVRQNPVFHPEIFVHLHTMYVCDEAIRIAKEEKLDEKDTQILLFAALTHDSAKYSHSQGEYPRITSRGHDIAGKPLAESFLYRIAAPGFLQNHVPVLVKEHMAYIGAQSEKAVRKLAERLEPSNIYMLSLLINADHSGRPPLAKGLPYKALRMLELSKRENVLKVKPKRILEGKHLKEMGLTPGPEFGKIIAEAYQLQMDGQITNLEEAFKWLENQKLDIMN